MLVLNERDLSALLPMNEVIDAVEEGFGFHARGRFRMPERMKVELPETGGTLLEMPCALIPDDADRPLSEPGGPRSRAALGTKIVTVFPDNPVRNVEAVQASYLLLDPSTGVPLALMDGRFITAIRTAATSATATKHLGPKGPWQLAVFGTGVQAIYHVEAMAAIGKVDRVAVVSRTDDRAHSFVDQVSRRFGLDCEILNRERAVESSNLICTCTSSSTPVFSGTGLKPGTHINAIGTFTAGARELDTETIRRSRVIIDDDAGAGVEAGEILIPILEGAIDASHATTTLADVIAGAQPGRKSEHEITVFKSCGLAFEDLVTAELAYRKARKA
ncbi:MAG: ornithine cyclodeaminase family protein [Blastocatellia bacterium]